MVELSIKGFLMNTVLFVFNLIFLICYQKEYAKKKWYKLLEFYSFGCFISMALFLIVFIASY